MCRCVRARAGACVRVHVRARVRACVRVCVLEADKGNRAKSSSSVEESSRFQLKPKRQVIVKAQ